MHLLLPVINFCITNLIALTCTNHFLALYRAYHEQRNIKIKIVDLFTFRLDVIWLSLVITVLLTWHSHTAHLRVLPIVGLQILFAGLIAISIGDIKHRIIPNYLSIPLLILGLGVNLFHTFTTPLNALLGAIMGYGLLGLIHWIGYKLKNTNVLGLGDAKLMGALGAWFGLIAVPMILLIAAMIGLLYALLILFYQQYRHRHTTREKQHFIPFGPFLALGALIYILWRSNFYQLLIGS